MAVDPTFNVEALVPSILREFDVGDAVALLRMKQIEVTGLAQTFEEYVGYLCSALEEPLTREAAPVLSSPVGSQCKGCQFYLDPADISDIRRSGWHECMSERYATPITIPRRDTYFGIYRSNAKQIEGFIWTEPLAIAEMAEATFPNGVDPQGILMFASASAFSGRSIRAPLIRTSCSTP